MDVQTFEKEIFENQLQKEKQNNALYQTYIWKDSCKYCSYQTVGLAHCLNGSMPLWLPIYCLSP